MSDHGKSSKRKGLRVNFRVYYKYIDEELLAVEPDVVVENRFSDFERGIDPIYEYVRTFDDE